MNNTDHARRLNANAIILLVIALLILLGMLAMGGCSMARGFGQDIIDASDAARQGALEFFKD